MRIVTLISFAFFCILHITAQVDYDTIPQLQVGYTETDMRTMGGAVDKVDAQQMKKGLVISPLDALSGQAAGVQVQRGSNQEAMVSAVRVRGTTSLTGGNDPLVIIDGVASDLATLSTIYPADIESFTILKDASETAQYGSRGASGVIEVATKKGKEGKFHISYEGNMGFESVYKKIDMLSADQFREAAKNMDLDIYDGGSSSIFQDAITRTGTIQNHHVAFGGGNESSNYRISLGVTDHKTVIKTNSMKNYIAKLDISQKAFDNKVTFDLGMFGSIQKTSKMQDLWKFFYSAAAFNPTIKNGKNQQGKYEGVPEAVWIANPSALLNMDDDEDYGHFSVHLKAKANLGWGIMMTLFGSYSYNTDNNAHYYPTYVVGNGEAYRADSRTEEMITRISFDKLFNFKKSSLKLFALAERQSSKNKGFNVTVTNFSTDEFGYHNISAGATRPWNGTGSFYQDDHLNSFLFTGQYTFLDRYSITANARTDGSSKVGKNNRWGFFPSVSASWTIWDKTLPHEQSLGKQNSIVDYLKLRFGAGLSGNLGGIDAYNSLQLLKPNGIVYVPTNESYTTLAFVRNANPDLKWETKRSFNVGLNFAMWDRRVVLTLDYYRTKVKNMLYLYDVPVPPFTYDKMLANLGAMQNSGFEAGFGITPLRNADMELSIGVNMSMERNKLLSLDGYYNGELLTAPKESGIADLHGAGFHGSSGVVSSVVGQPLGVFFLPHCTGLTTDENGAKHYQLTEEKYNCGQAMPKMRMNANIAFRYKQWDIAAQINGAFGHKIFNGTALTYMNMLSLPYYNVMEDAPKMNIQDQSISDYWLESGDFLHLDYITIGWNVPCSNKYVQKLRLSVSVNNLFTITGYSGLTPLINSSVVNGTLGVDDKNSFPPYRTFSFGLGIHF